MGAHLHCYTWDTSATSQPPSDGLPIWIIYQSRRFAHIDSRRRGSLNLQAEELARRRSVYMKTVIPSGVNTPRNWHVIDAENAVLGRVASKAASMLMGKHKPTYTPYIDMGDHVIVVINAAKVRLTGRKEEQKFIAATRAIPAGSPRPAPARCARRVRSAWWKRRSRACFRRISWASRCTGSCRCTRVPSTRTRRRSQWPRRLKHKGLVVGSVRRFS